MSERCLYTAETSIPLSLCDDSAVISYQECEIELNFESVPPHGDEIYSIKISNLGLVLPFWIYGRNLMFLDNHFLIAEAVKIRTWDPINNVVINLLTGEYIDLQEWYHRTLIKKKEIILENDFTGKSLRIKDISSLEWKKE